MHFIGFKTIHFSYATMPVPIFRSLKGYPKRCCHSYTEFSRTLTLIAFSIDRKQGTDTTRLETKDYFSESYICPIRSVNATEIN